MKRNWRLLRANTDLFAVLFLMSMTGTMTLPILPIYAIEHLGATEFQSTMIFVTSALIGMVLGPPIGRWADGSQRYHAITVAALAWLALGPLAILTASSVLHMIAVSAIFFGIYMVPSTQIFAIARKRFEQSTEWRGDDVGIIRVAHIAGWVIGPVLPGLLLFAGATYRMLFMLQAASYVAVALVALVIIRGPARTAAASEQSPDAAQGSRQGRPTRVPIELWLVLAAVIMMMSGDMTRIAALPLVVTRVHGAAVEHAAFIFAVVPLIEIPASFLAIWIARRYGSASALLFGAACVLVYYGGMPLATELWQLYAIQAFYAFAPATAIGVGIVYAQSLLPGRPGFASSSVFSALSAAIVLGSALLAVGMATLGPLQTFWLPALGSLGGMAAISVVIMRGDNGEATAGGVEPGSEKRGIESR